MLAENINQHGNMKWKLLKISKLPSGFIHPDLNISKASMSHFKEGLMYPRVSVPLTFKIPKAQISA